MRKRILSCLLTVFMVFGTGQAVVGADVRMEEALNGQAPLEESQADSVVAEPTEIEADFSGELPGKTEADFSEALPTGFGGMIQMDLAPEDVPEIYEPSENETRERGSAAYLSGWDSYSTNYYYNLLSDAQRALWDSLDQMCHAYLTGTETLTNASDYYSASSGLNIRYYRTKGIVYQNLTRQSAYDTMSMFVFSNPQYYFLQSISGVNATSGSAGIAMLTVNESFANGAVRMAETRKLQGIINSWLQQINAQPTDLLKEKKIHDMICEKVTYDPYYNTFSQNKYNQTIYSVFCTDTTVCAGYSQAMQLLCNAAGIDCAVVTSEEHEWNIVRLNGTWYYVDCTWDDNIADRENWASAYFYFNRSSQAFMNDPNPYNVRSHVVEPMWYGFLPELNFDSGATNTEIGSIHMPAVTLTAPQITASGDKVSITAPAGGTIYYTTDGSNPSVASTKSKRYTGVITLSGVTVIRAAAVANACYDSGISGATITPQYNITISANGGYIGKKNVKEIKRTVVHGNTLGKIANPKRKGYAFLGWYTQKSGGTKAAASAKVSASGTYYAHWAKINPKKTALSSVKNKSGRAMKITVKNVKTASGYQIRYAANKNMSGAKRKEISETSCTIKKLSKGKTYYVQVRMYQKESVSGKKSYGPWSKAKTVKIKK